MDPDGLEEMEVFLVVIFGRPLLADILEPLAMGLDISSFK